MPIVVNGATMMCAMIGSLLGFILATTTGLVSDTIGALSGAALMDVGYRMFFSRKLKNKLVGAVAPQTGGHIFWIPVWLLALIGIGWNAVSRSQPPQWVRVADTMFEISIVKDWQAMPDLAAEMMEDPENEGIRARMWGGSGGITVLVLWPPEPRAIEGEVIDEIVSGEAELLREWQELGHRHIASSSKDNLRIVDLLGETEGMPIYSRHFFFADRANRYYELSALCTDGTSEGEEVCQASLASLATTLPVSERAPLE